MAVAEMSALTLVALSKDKSAILDELKKCGAVQLRSAKEYALADKGESRSAEDIRSLISRVEKAISKISSAGESFAEKGETVGVKDGFGVTAKEFFAIGDRGEELNATLKEVEDGEAKINSLKSEVSALKARVSDYLPYAEIPLKLSEFSSTETVEVLLGTVGGDKATALGEKLKEEGIYFDIYQRVGNYCAVALAFHKDDGNKAEEIISSFGFKKFGAKSDKTASEEIDALNSEISNKLAKEKEILKNISEKSDRIRELKIYSDYLAFLAEKAEAEENFGKTEKAFILEGYVPTERKEEAEDLLKHFFALQRN